jgi:hypothetical protein
VLEFEYLHARKKISVDARALTSGLAETFGVAVCSFPFPRLSMNRSALNGAPIPSTA